MPEKSTLDLRVTPAQAYSALLACIQTREPLLLVSGPGIGKSSLTEQAARESGALFVLEHGAIAAPEDSRGLPVPNMDRRVGEWFPFGNLAVLRDATSPVVCLLDDLGQAPRAVQAAYMQWVQARRIGDIEVSQWVTFVAATNRRGDKSGVDALLSALGSRFVTRLVLKACFQDWAAWYLKQPGLPVALVSFLQWCPQYFSDTFFQEHISLDPERATPNPRTYHALGRLTNMMHGAKINGSVALAAYAGCAGEEVAVAYKAFLDVFEGLPHPDTFMTQPERAPLFKDSEVSKRWAVCSMLLSRVKSGDGDTFTRASKYVARLPEEYRYFWYTSAPAANPRVCETATYVDWSVKNQSAMV